MINTDSGANLNINNHDSEHYNEQDNNQYNEILTGDNQDSKQDNNHYNKNNNSHDIQQDIRDGYVSYIPVRNIWLLMLYASDLMRQLKKTDRVLVEENLDDIPDLIANILLKEVNKRIRRNLSFDYQSKARVLSRVRGRIDLFKTERDKLLDKGKVFCRFDELTVNTPRNRLVRAALDKISKLVQDTTLSKKCRSLSGTMRQMGVIGEKPSDIELSIEQFGRNNSHDRLMVDAAHLVFNLAIPTELVGDRYLSSPDKEIKFVRKVFERGIAGFYKFHLDNKWDVIASKTIHWQKQNATSRMDNIFPSMITDITIENKTIGKHIVIDTKFNSVLIKGWHRESSIRSQYIYQMYAYLRSQEGLGNSLQDNSYGMLLHPSVGEKVHESVIIQGHKINFATIDLTFEAKQIKQELLDILEKSYSD